MEKGNNIQDMKKGKTVICSDIDGEKYKVDSNQLIFRPSVYGIIIKNGKILLSKQWGGYNLPGGGVDLGETIEETLKREILEETGLKIKIGQIITCKNSFFKLPYSGINVQSILIYYLCKTIGGKLSSKSFSEDEKQYSDHPEWVNLNKISKLTFRCSVDSFEIIKEGIKKIKQ